MGAGEILLNSVDRDGMGIGYDIYLLNLVANSVNIPVIACGGVGDWHHFQEAFEKNPNFAEGWNKRATVYYMLGKFDASMMDIYETLKLEPRHFGAMDGMGLIFIHLEQFDKAIDIYDQMLKIFPNNSSTKQKKEMLINRSSESA